MSKKFLYTYNDGFIIFDTTYIISEIIDINKKKLKVENNKCKVDLSKYKEKICKFTFTLENQNIDIYIPNTTDVFDIKPSFSNTDKEFIDIVLCIDKAYSDKNFAIISYDENCRINDKIIFKCCTGKEIKLGIYAMSFTNINTTKFKGIII